MAEKIIKLSILAEEIAEEELRIIRRDITPPEAPPYLEEGTELFEPTAESEPLEEVDRAWGGRPNVPVENVIRAICRNIGARGYDLHISDRSYTGYSIWEVIRYLRADRTNFMRYIREVFDCDDFAQVLQGNVNRFMPGIPFGTLWYGGKGWGHAVNIFYCCRYDRIFLIEPQNDRIYYFNKKAWKPWMIII
jgi:hypothetical protein